MSSFFSSARSKQFFIGRKWVGSSVPVALDVISPATEHPVAIISAGGAADINKAVSAAREAFPSFSVTSRASRLGLLRRVLACYNVKMGAPITVAHEAQVWTGRVHLEGTIAALRALEFEHELQVAPASPRKGLGWSAPSPLGTGR